MQEMLCRLQCTQESFSSRLSENLKPKSLQNKAKSFWLHAREVVPYRVQFRDGTRKTFVFKASLPPCVFKLTVVILKFYNAFFYYVIFSFP